MGRRLAAGIPIRFNVYSKNPNFNLAEEKDKIIKEINKNINVNFYNISFEKGEDEDYLAFSPKEELFNVNIKEAFKELRKEFEINCLFNCMNENNNEIFNEDLMKENYQINLQLVEFYRNHQYCFIDNYENEKKEMREYFVSIYSLFHDLKNIDHYLRIDIALISFWLDENKFDGEDEINILHYLNHFSRNKFENDLANNFLFYISG